VRQAIAWIVREHTIGEAEGVFHIAVRDRRDEGALNQIRIARIGPQRLAKESRRGHGIALGARDKRGEIIAGRAFADSKGLLWPNFPAPALARSLARPEKSTQQQEHANRARRGGGTPAMIFPGKLQLVGI
jgi:hypothetical protein